MVLGSVFFLGTPTCNNICGGIIESFETIRMPDAEVIQRRLYLDILVRQSIYEGDVVYYPRRCVATYLLEGRSNLPSQTGSYILLLRISSNELLIKDLI